jgi:hypothetical protein
MQTIQSPSDTHTRSLPLIMDSTSSATSTPTLPYLFVGPAIGFPQRTPLWVCPHDIPFWTIRPDRYRRVSSTCPECCLFAGRSTLKDLRWVEERFYEESLNEEDDDDDYYPTIPHSDNLFLVDPDELIPGQHPLAGVSNHFWDRFLFTRAHLERVRQDQIEQRAFAVANTLLLGQRGELGTLLREGCKSLTSEKSTLVGG